MPRATLAHPCAAPIDGKEAARGKRRKFKEEFSTAFPQKNFVMINDNDLY